MADLQRPNNSTTRRRRRRWKQVSILRVLFLLHIYGASLAAAFLYLAITTINEDLPQDLTKLLEWQPYKKSTVLSSDGDEIGSFSIENRRIVPLERMPSHVPAAFIATEDHRFFEIGRAHV